MKTLLLIWVGIVQTCAGFTQNQNLVPNPSFEEYINCPDNSGQIWNVEPWERVMGSVDYFHECGTNNQGIPENWGGTQEARTGDAYIGLVVCYSPLAVINPLMTNVREFAGVPLKEPLIAAIVYRLEFFINLRDICCYTVRNMGAYLSQGQPLDQIDHLLSRQPQLKYNEEAFLDNKTDWVRLSGNFTAQGGENFLTIGNFDDDENTDTLAVPCNNSGQNHAYYYIDDVSVIPVDSLVGIGERERVTMNIYPNPATGHFTIEQAQIGETLALYDLAGKRVFSMVLHSSKQTIAIGDMPAGVYVATLEKDGAIVERKKLIIQ